MPYFQQQRQRQARERRKAMVKYTNLIFALSTFTGSLPPYYRIHRGEEEGGEGGGNGRGLGLVGNKSFLAGIDGEGEP